MFSDYKSQNIFEKRNAWRPAVRGQLVDFSDDDDGGANNYIDMTLNAANQNPSVDYILFDQFPSRYEEPMNVSFGIRNPHRQLWRGEEGFLGDIKRPPDHLCLFQRDIPQSEESC